MIVNGVVTSSGYDRPSGGVVGTTSTSRPVSSSASLTTAWTGSSFGSMCPPGGSHAFTFRVPVKGYAPPADDESGRGEVPDCTALRGQSELPADCCPASAIRWAASCCSAASRVLFSALRLFCLRIDSHASTAITPQIGLKMTSHIPN